MDRPRIRSRTFAGVLACAFTGPLLVLGACGGGDDSVADPPISTSPSSSSPTSAPHRETPEHFIRRWFDAGTRMQNTGDTKQYLALQDGCQGCDAVAARVEKAYKAGGYYRTKGVRTIREIAIHPSKDRRTVEVTVDLFPTTYRERRGGQRRHFDGGPAHFEVGIERKGESWIVVSFVQVAS